MDTPILANDKYRATTRSTYIASPADTEIQVTAIPANLPTQVTLGWNTIYETVFRVEGTSGDNASNYALTGVTRVKGTTENIPEGIAVNCLNQEEYFNQWGEQITAVQEVADIAAVAGLTVNSITSSTTPSPVITTVRNLYIVTALAAAAEFAVPTGTPTQGMGLILRIKDNGTARALTWNAL